MKHALALLILALSTAFGFYGQAQTSCQSLPEGDCVVACGQTCKFKQKSVPQNFQIDLPKALGSLTSYTIGPSQEKGKFNLPGDPLPNHARPFKLPFTITLPGDFYDGAKAGTDIEIKKVPYISSDAYLTINSSVRLSPGTPTGQTPSFSGAYVRCISKIKNGLGCLPVCTPNWVDLACSSTAGVRNTKDGCGAFGTRNDSSCTVTPACTPMWVDLACSSTAGVRNTKDVGCGAISTRPDPSCTVSVACTPKWVDLGCSSTAGVRNTTDGCKAFGTRPDTSCTVPVAVDCVGIWGACTGSCGTTGAQTFTVLLAASVSPPGKACPESPASCTMPACVTCSSPVNRNICSDGSGSLAPSSSIIGTNTIYTWSCGVNSCSEAVPITPPPPVLGKVACTNPPRHYRCSDNSSGSAQNASQNTVTSTLYEWTCGDDNCAEIVGVSGSAPISGECNNSILNGCLSGTLEAGSGNWKCKGSRGGRDSDTCQFVVGPPPATPKTSSYRKDWLGCDWGNATWFVYTSATTGILYYERNDRCNNPFKRETPYRWDGSAWVPSAAPTSTGGSPRGTCLEAC